MKMNLPYPLGVAWLLTFCVFLCVSVNVDADVKVRPDKVQLGESFTVVIQDPYLREALPNLDMSLFEQDFVIDDVYQDSELLRLKLYPLQPGEFVIPPQTFGHLVVPELTLKVENNPDVSVEWIAPNPRVYNQQLLTWMAKVTVSNPAYNVRYLAQNRNSNDAIETLILEQAGDVKHALNQHSLLDSFVGITHPLSAAYLMPNHPSISEVELFSPMVQVKNQGNKRWKFFDKSVKVQLEPLPLFLPMSAAVGSIEWQSDLNRRFFESGQLYLWEWTLSSMDMQVDYLKSAVYQLVTQLERASHIEFLSEATQAQERLTSDGLVSQLVVTIPFRLKSVGLASFPAMNLQYFNPQTGLVEQQRIDRRWALALPSWLVWVVQWGLLVMVLTTFFVVLLAVKQRLHNWRFRRALKEAIQSDTSVDDVWQAMLEWQRQHRQWKVEFKALYHPEFKSRKQPVWQRWIVQIESVPTQNSFSRYQQWFEFFYGRDPALIELFELMNRHYYADHLVHSDQDTLNIEMMRLVEICFLNKSL